MKKFAVLLLAMLPLVTLADEAPMSRDEWERMRMHHQVVESPAPLNYVFAIDVGLLLVSMVLSIRSRRHLVSSRKQWKEFIVLAIIIIPCCVVVEVVFHPFSSFLNGL